MRASRCLLVGFLVAAALSRAADPVPPQATSDPLAAAGTRYEKGEWAEAAELYARAARSGRNAAIAWFNYGNCMVQLKRRGEAVAAWKKALEWAPSFKRARLNLAILAEEDRDLGLAVQQYRRLYELDRDDPLVPLRLGELNLDLEDPVGAEQWFLAARDADSLAPEAWKGIARARLAQGDTAGARRALSDWSSRIEDSTGREWFAVAGLWERVGNLEAARRATEAGLARAPNAREGWLRLARLSQLARDEATAVAVLRQAVAHLPDDTLLWRALGQAALRAQDASVALQALERAGSGSETVRLARLLAAWLEVRGDASGAARARALIAGS